MEADPLKVTSETSPQKKRGVVLLLSGGGFRATLFHLGVFNFLHDSRLIVDVRYIASVSGGSIVAGHVLQNFEAYSTGDFQAAAQGLIRLAQRDVRGRVVRRRLARLLIQLVLFPLSFPALLCCRSVFSQRLTDLVRKEFDSLYGKKATLGITATSPYGDILSCSLTTGKMCCFSKHGFSFGNNASIRNTGIPLSLAVACSAAFPPLFPPIRVDSFVLNTTQEQFGAAQYLSDGGVYDNTGIDLPLRMIQQDDMQDIGYVFLSDAGKQSDHLYDQAFVNPIKRAMRATDLMMDHICQLEFDLAKKQNTSIAFIRTRIADVITEQDESAALNPQDQRNLAALRTDLNVFSEYEIDQLVQDGYIHALHALHQLSSSNTTQGPVRFFPNAKPHDLRKRSEVSLGIWQWRDAFSVLNPVLIGALLVEAIFLFHEVHRLLSFLIGFIPQLAVNRHP